MRKWIVGLSLIFCLQAAAAFADPTPQQRQAVSDQMMYQLQQQGGVVTPAAGQSLANQVFNSLLPYTRRRDVQYRLEVDQNNNVNSTSTPDGRVVLYSGLLNKIQADPAALAFVEAHELAHLESDDADKKMDMQVGTLLVGTIFAWRSDLNTKIGAALAHQFLNSGYSRNLEVRADQRALALMQQAGYDPNGALVALKVAAAAEGTGARVFPYKPKAMDRYNDAMAWMNEHQVAVHQPSDAYVQSIMVASNQPPQYNNYPSQYNNNYPPPQQPYQTPYPNQPAAPPPPYQAPPSY
ncbi:MAG: M48 family metalloprotease [Candidatus Xenobia bacterium]